MKAALQARECEKVFGIFWKFWVQERAVRSEGVRKQLILLGVTYPQTDGTSLAVSVWLDGLTPVYEKILADFGERKVEREMVNRLLNLLLVSLLLLLLLACGTGSSQQSKGTDTLQRVQSEGKIRAAYFVEPPAVMKDPNTGELSGTFVEAIKFIASQLKVKVEFTEVDLAKFAAGLQTGSYDVSIGPTFRTIPRASSVGFTRTIFYLGYDGLVSKGKETRFKSESDLDQPGVTIAVKEGSAIHRYAQDNYKKAKVLVLSGTDLSLPLQAVSSGQADVGLMNEHTVEFYRRQHPEVAVILADKPIQVTGMSWAVRNDDLVWLNFLDTSLEFLESTGQMAQWERTFYFGQPLKHSMPSY